MSFAEGFAKTFTPFATAFAGEIVKADFDSEKQFMTDWKTQQKEFDKLRLKDNELRDTAKTLVGSLPGVPPSAWTNVYQDLKMGRTLENIREDLLNADFNPMAPVTVDARIGPDLVENPDTVDAQMSASGLTSTTEAETPVRKFSFMRTGQERAMDKIREKTGMSDAEIAQVQTGRFTPDPVSTEFAIKPRGKGSKLTQSDVAGAYMDAVRNGPEALADFKANTLPNMMAALETAGTGAKETTELSRALGDLEAARASGDPQRVARAEANVNRIIQAEEIKKGAGEANTPKQFVVMNEDGTSQFVSGFSRITANGRQVVDSAGNPVQGNVREVTEQERKDGDEAIKSITAETGKYRESLTNTSGAMRLTGELLDLARNDRRVLTSVAGGVRNIQGLLREANSLTSVLNDVIKDNSGQPVTLQQFEQAAQARGVLTGGQTLEQVASRQFGNLSMGPTAENLANARSLFESKLILMTFRAGGLEGQSGNAMSNKDFDRLSQMLQSSANPEVFERNITDYVRGRANALVDQERQINTSPLIQRFQDQYGYSPVSNVATPLEQFVDSRNDPQLKTAYDAIMGGGGQPPAAPRAQPQPQQGQAPERPGFTFKAIDPKTGLPIYQKNGTNELFISNPNK